MLTAPRTSKRRRRSGRLAAALGCLLGLAPAVAIAQPGMGGPGGGPMGPMGPGGGGMGAPGGGPGGRREKKEGPAEEAPKDKQALRPIEAVPAQPQRTRRLQLFDLHGYMRLRADFFHRLNMGLPDFVDVDGAPVEPAPKFFRPPAEMPEQTPDGLVENDASCLMRLDEAGVSQVRAQQRCNRRNGFPSANLRLRLEPTINVTDTVSVHSQVDLLDNIVLGSSPDSYSGENPFAPLDLYTRTQEPPSRENDLRDSILVKRAWGRIRFGFGLDLQFGRMPWTWGMGMVANHGMGYARLDQADIIRHVDQDYGDSVDSLRFGFTFGKDRRRAHTIALSWDWASSGPTTSQIMGQYWDAGGTVGQPFSVEKFDNVYQWSLSIERRDDVDMLRRKLSLGNPVVNYGFITWLRYQDLDRAFGAEYDSLRDYSSILLHRKAIIATPDLWFRVNWRTLRVELEMAGTFGRFNLRRDLSDQPDDPDSFFSGLTAADLDRQIVASFGYALEFKYGFFRDKFHIGFDQGMATGDTAPGVYYPPGFFQEPPPDGTTPAQQLNPQAPLESDGDRTMEAFRFNPAFNVDLLLFREILGTVSNAAYFKPWAAFYFLQHFSVRADVMYAMAARRQATLGNKWSYGIELDGALRYHDAREPIFFQLQYGVMFPLPAFNRIRVFDGQRDNARAVQTVQAQLGIRF